MTYCLKVLIKKIQKKEFYCFSLVYFLIIFLISGLIFMFKKTEIKVINVNLDLLLLVKTQINFIKNFTLTDISIIVKLFLSNFVFLIMGLFIQLFLFKSIKRTQLSSKFICFFYMSIMLVYSLGIGLKIGFANLNIGNKFNLGFFESITLLAISIMWHGIPELLANVLFVYIFVYEKYIKTLKSYRVHPTFIAVINNYYIKLLFLLMPLCAILLLISAYLETQAGLSITYYKNNYLFK